MTRFKSINIKVTYIVTVFFSPLNHEPSRHVYKQSIDWADNETLMHVGFVIRHDVISINFAFSFNDTLGVLFTSKMRLLV